MLAVPDAIGTAPIAVRLSPDGQTVYVANYLARNVVAGRGRRAARPERHAGEPALRGAADSSRAATNNDCPAGDRLLQPSRRPRLHDRRRLRRVAALHPRRRTACRSCSGRPVSTLSGGIAADPLAAALLDGKILFNTAARDASVPNDVGLGAAAPLFNNAALTAKVPGSVVSTAHDASYVTCSTCHADFGGQDGRTWDFSQFGASLRNTMDLRGRAGLLARHVQQQRRHRSASSTPPAAPATPAR